MAQEYLTPQQLALYFGCNAQCFPPEPPSYYGNESYPVKIKKIDGELLEDKEWGKIKPILRHLSSITQEEKIELNTFVNFKSLNMKLSNKNPDDFWKHYAIVTEFYLQKQFDMFNWIEQGLALDKTKINK